MHGEATSSLINGVASKLPSPLNFPAISASIIGDEAEETKYEDRRMSVPRYTFSNIDMRDRAHTARMAAENDAARDKAGGK